MNDNDNTLLGILLLLAIIAFLVAAIVAAGNGDFENMYHTHLCVERLHYATSAHDTVAIYRSDDFCVDHSESPQGHIFP